MRERLDQALVGRGLVMTRARARDLIRQKLVRVDGVVAHKPAQGVPVDATLDVDREAAAYASRGAHKLIAALDAFEFSPDGRVVLDVGASTGGFTDVVLRRGARHVFAVDTGRDQLAAALRCNDRVTNLEQTDARTLTPDIIRQPVGAIVADVSFISLLKVLAPVLPLAAPECWLIGLIKPQFEAGPDAVARGGIVRDTDVHDRVVKEVRAWFAQQHRWRVLDVIPAPITGQGGNQEFLIGARLDG